MGIYFGKIFVSYYGLMILTGIIIGLVLSIPLIKKFCIDFNDYLIITASVALSCMLGSKLLYCMVNLKETLYILKNPSIDNLKIFLNSGFVFYGGLVLSLITVMLIKRHTKLDVEKIIGTTFPIFIIAHGFGRIGCGIVGCCYGVRYDGLFAIMYKSSIIAPNNVHLFPTQYTESVFQIVVGIVFYTLILWHGIRNVYIRAYLLLYLIFRFFIEYLRGDVARGIYGPFSVSQLISIILLAILVFDIYLKTDN